jgi:hypothetical protein
MSLEWLFIFLREAVQTFTWKMKGKAMKDVIMTELTVQNKNFRHKVYVYTKYETEYLIEEIKKCITT